MEDSILDSIKKLVGVAPEVTDFDTDIIIHINSVMNILNQLGAPSLIISDNTLKWSDFISGSKLELIKSYIYLKVRLLFDTSVSSSVTNAINEQVKELEWRISVTVDPGEETE